MRKSVSGTVWPVILLDDNAKGRTVIVPCIVSVYILAIVEEIVRP